ncbi:MAG: gas vesicle protein GvpO [Pseudomonadota bacterium]
MNLRDVTRLARELSDEMTGQAFDSIVRCEKREDGWIVEVDVLESKARLGDDDLLTTYQYELDAEGGLTGYRRLRKHSRFENDAVA